jgi:hypothetical protein
MREIWRNKYLMAANYDLKKAPFIFIYVYIKGAEGFALHITRTCASFLSVLVPTPPRRSCGPQPLVYLCCAYNGHAVAVVE